jgi:hypothetical protein
VGNRVASGTKIGDLMLPLVSGKHNQAQHGIDAIPAYPTIKEITVEATNWMLLQEWQQNELLCI